MSDSYEFLILLALLAAAAILIWVLLADRADRTSLSNERSCSPAADVILTPTEGQAPALPELMKPTVPTAETRRPLYSSLWIPSHLRPEVEPSQRPLSAEQEGRATERRRAHQAAVNLAMSRKMISVPCDFCGERNEIERGICSACGYRLPTA